MNIQDRIQISELVLQQKARIVEDSTCVTDILNLFPSEHVVLKELRSECEKLADELDTVSRERSRLERKYNAMMGTKQTSLNRVDELKKLIQEAKASIASFDLLTQAATAEIRVAQQREVSLKEELTVTVAQLEESVNAYSEVKKIAKVQIDTNNDENGIEEPIKTRDQTGGDNGNDYDDICEEACIDESYESPEDEKLTVNNISTQIQSSEKISLESDCSDTATTTAESTPQRSEVNSSNTVTETSACDEVILSLSDTPIQLQTITTTCPSSSSKHPESETTSDGHQVGQESVETSNTNNIQSQNLVSTTSIDMLPNALNTSVKTIGVTTSSISISSSSSMKPPTKPVKPRSKPPEKLSIGGNVFGGSQELESEFVEISI